MKRRLGLLVMIVSFVGTPACRKTDKKTETPPPTPATETGSAAADPWQKPDAKKDPLKSVFFWTIEKDGKQTHLLGTMHMGVEAETRLPQIVWDKLDAAKTFAMEADLSDPKLASSVIRSGGTLADDLGADYWKKLTAIVGPAMAGQLEQMTPMGAAAILSLKDLPKTSPMDGVLLGRATNQKKKIVYLEEGALQAAVLSKYMDLRALKMMIDNHESGKQQAQQMLDSYLSGDPAAILKVVETQKAEALKYGYKEAEYAQQMEDMLYKRNRSWIEAIEKMHAEGEAFIAVGALHLIGPQSVLEMLEAKGYKTARITP